MSSVRTCGFWSVGSLVTLAMVAGCAQPAARGVKRAQDHPGAGRAAPDGVAASREVVAVVDGVPVGRLDLWQSIAEGGGGQALEELVLDRGLARVAESRGITVTSEDGERERVMLLEAISDEFGADESLSDQALARVRVARGLGPHRFAALLKRTAIMRALVRSDVVVSEEEVDAEVELAIGTKVTAVVAMFATEKEAALVRAGLEGDASQRIERLSALARARSIDPSASDGGLVGPIHAKDPRVPGTLRSVLETQAIGELSPVLATDGGYVVILIESRAEKRSRTPEVEEAARTAIAARKQRVAMDKLARSILSGASVNVIDESLRWSWQRARQR